MEGSDGVEEVEEVAGAGVVAAGLDVDGFEFAEVGCEASEGLSEGVGVEASLGSWEGVGVCAACVDEEGVWGEGEGEVEGSRLGWEVVPGLGAEGASGEEGEGEGAGCVVGPGPQGEVEGSSSGERVCEEGEGALEVEEGCVVVEEEVEGLLGVILGVAERVGVVQGEVQGEAEVGVSAGVAEVASGGEGAPGGLEVARLVCEAEGGGVEGEGGGDGEAEGVLVEDDEAVGCRLMW